MGRSRRDDLRRAAGVQDPRGRHPRAEGELRRLLRQVHRHRRRRPGHRNALKRGQVDAADLFTTDPAIDANDFVVLEDPKTNFAAQNIVPIIAKDKVTDGVKTVLNGIQAKLTTDGLIAMNSKVSNDKEDPAEVAKAWLADNGLDASGTAVKGVNLTVGSANFPENVILAEIYAGALEAQGATIEKSLNIGSREKYYPALKSGSLDLFPEYTGTILTYIDKTSKATTPDDVYAALTKALPSNLVALDMAEAQNSDAVVVTKETADKFKLKTIADLEKKGDRGDAEAACRIRRMADDVYLHIGPPKTGTTYIQQVLWENKQNLARQQIFLPLGRRRLQYDAVADLRGGLWANANLSTTWDKLVKKAHRRPGSSVVSEELLAAMPDALLREGRDVVGAGEGAHHLCCPRLRARRTRELPAGAPGAVDAHL